MNTVTLPSGATVTFKDASTLKVKHRNRVIKAGDSVEGTVSKGIAFNEALIAAVIDSWSLDLIPPDVKPESLEELSIADYDFLTEKAQEFASVLFPSLAKTEETQADPKVLIGDFKI
jgi:hypothetical protein